MPYPAARRDAATTTKSTKSYQDLKCKIEQCGGRCLRAGEVCRLVPDTVQQKIWMGALKKVGKAPAATKTTISKTPRFTRTTKKTAAKPSLETGGAKAASTKPVTEQEPSTKAKAVPPVEEKPAKKIPKEARESSAPVNQKELDRRRSELVKKYGEKLISDAEASLASALKNTNTYIRVHGNETLGKIIDSGRFKNLFETGSGNAVAKQGVKHMKDARKKAEKYMFNQDKIDDSERAIYGYIARDSMMNGKNYKESEARGVTFYGNVAVKLKQNKAQDTTFTSDDSLSRNPPPMAIQPSSVSKPNIATLFELKDIQGKFGRATKEEMREMLEKVAKAKDIGEISKITGSRPYVEAQIHGQVKTSDFEELVYMDGDKPDKKVLSWAKENNVKITVKR